MAEQVKWAQDELTEVGVPVADIKARFAALVEEAKALHKAGQGPILQHDSDGVLLRTEDNPNANLPFVLPVERLRKMVDDEVTTLIEAALIADAKHDLVESIVAEYA